jgi:hypothetical protein
LVVAAFGAPTPPCWLMPTELLAHARPVAFDLAQIGLIHIKPGGRTRR